MSIIAREKKPKGGGQSPQFKMRIDPALKEQLDAVAAEEGVMILIAGANVVRFAPALNVSEEEVNSGLDRVERACARFLAGVSS